MGAGACVRVVPVQGEESACPRMGHGAVSKCTENRGRQVSYSWRRRRNTKRGG